MSQTETAVTTAPVTGFSHVQLNVVDVPGRSPGTRRCSAWRSCRSTAISPPCATGPPGWSSSSARPSGSTSRRSPVDHLAFAVPDGEALQAWADHLTAVGIEHPGVVLELGKPSLQLVDPDGNEIELVAPAPR